MSEERFDAIVIGSGQGGSPLAVKLAESGKRTAIIERGAVGGTCVNVGCTPTKTMYASAKVAAYARRAREYGVVAENVRADLKAIRMRKQAIVDRFRTGNEQHFASTKNLELVRGEARFVSAHAIEVGARTLTAPWIFINTGARPSIPKIEGMEHVRCVNSTSIMELDEAPERLVVVGGGYIGLEFGQMFARFGSKVTILQRSKQLLPHEDEDVATELTKILRDEGLEVLLSAEAKKATPAAKGFDLEVGTPAGTKKISGDVMLFAVGRTPNTDRLALDRAGVMLSDDNFICTNDKLETNVSGIWALGDVNGGPAFTHISYDDYRIIRTNLIEGGSASKEDRLVPYTVYTDPQLGRVGLSEREAKLRGLSFRTVKLEMSHVARAIESSETHGFIKVLVDQKTDLLLGCAVLGMEGGELMSMLELAMMGGISSKRLRDAIFAHPTLAESFNNLFW